MASRFTIVGVGEVLFDIFPDHQCLGGAPLNVAVHAHQLGKPRGGQGVVLSRIGQDDLGDAVFDELKARGMRIDHLQTDPDRDTGRAYIDLKPDGEPSFQIVDNAAWDVIQFDPDTEDLARRCSGICFGTLAQRDAQSRTTIYRFLDTARPAVRLFDVNLRDRHDDARIIRPSCERATIVKANSRELLHICQVLGLGHVGRGEVNELDRKAMALLERFNLRMVVLTRATQGTVLFTAADRAEGEPAHYAPVPNADSIGAGDACSAAVLVGTVLRLNLQQIANLANHAGAFVASQRGATPDLPDAIVQMAS